MDWRFHDALDADSDRRASQVGLDAIGESALVVRDRLRLHLVPLLIAIGFVFPGPVASAETCDHARCETRIAQVAESQKDKRRKEILVRFVRLLHDGRSKKHRGDLPGAIRSFHAALAVTDDWIAQDPEDKSGRRMRALALENVGSTLFAQGDLASALVFFSQALEVRKDIAVDYATRPGFQRRLAANYEWIGLVHSASGHTKQALESHLASLAILKELAEQHPEDASALRDLAIAHGVLANAWHDLGEMQKALESASADLAISEELLKAAPDDGSRRMDLALSLHNIGNIHYGQGEYQKAYESFNKCGEITREVIVEGSGRTDRQKLFGKCLHSLGDAQFMLGRRTIALVNYRLGLAVAEGLSEKDPADIGLHVDVMLGHATIARLHDEGTIGRDEALWHLKKALKVVQELEGSGRLAPRYAWLAAEIRDSLEALGR